MSRILQFPKGKDQQHDSDGPDRMGSHTDELTGFYHRCLFEDRLSLETARCRRQGGALSAIRLDVDRFRQVNELEGADAAKQLLVSLAGILRETARSTDVVGRWGEDQFCMILTDTDLRAATFIADYLREAAASVEDPLSAPISCSIGVAQWDPSSETGPDFLDRLEMALGSSKESDGNGAEAAATTERSHNPAPEHPERIDPSSWGVPRAFFVVEPRAPEPIVTDSVSY